ncbi:DeoR/GlpR family DNA-binding transcription regulator [Nocardiopsis sp. FR4]|uniref:DeoR/GlpR family DNA-binding transcription regulator n=1 Tax=Nocardiopsis sp. FR4 TaxID=2605985 RepID=UPI001F413CFA|nr:DeoR family transcriptional regulator [Nocardiopsis sp. FR4]
MVLSRGGSVSVGYGEAEALRPPPPRLAEARERIARAAAAEVPRDGVILLDSGPEAEMLASLLPAAPGLTVVTNSVTAALRLSPRADLGVHLLGGRVRGLPATVAHVHLLEQLHVDVAFLTTGGVSLDRGLTCQDPAEVMARRAMVRASRRVVLLADRARIGDDQLARFAVVSEVDHLITEAGPDTRELNRLRGRGPSVLEV